MPSRHYPAPAASASTSLTDTVAETIRQQLIHGQLRAGQRLSEAQLAEQLDISRNTLREVFRTLIKEGLLHHEPNRGVSVVVPTIADIIDIYRVRRLIEGQALAQAWPRHPAHKRMQQAMTQAYQARDAGDWLAVGSANMAFHAGIVALADSERLSAMFSDISAELRLAFGLLDDPEFLHAPYVDQNAQLLELFEAGQTQTAAQALENYLIQSERMVLSVYARRLE
ncbi:GntR family transcriptional regulator [Corticibacter populi]|uniref:GntR family transcriptional regulator n=1 Tax=Corticibacter populi TaxID=1550736 RepID=A0A3M6QTZ9_9BURK|nr:GntR family transcriptional regulator [Corticibacter populi]RMX06486.1 GntR family transcriptional regulator [Corticibacter populi]RZS31955.1 DNA-binding GntR family transcriptional regulator [Corticibacter populi]